VHKLLSVWNGAISIDGTVYDNHSAIPSDFDFSGCTTIVLLSNKERSASQEAKASTKEYVVTVRQYMTKEATPSFDFMAKWNNNIPMPLRTMVGTIEKETPGMYKMKLHGDTTADQMQTCMRCGRPITNPVSKYFGMGPECGGHSYTNPFNSSEELKQAIDDYRKNYLSKIVWEGWVIKSSITSMEER
jgi:hypothetical protein